MTKEAEYYHDEADGVHSGICRACKKYSNSVSNDSGYCGECD
jgi:hypothetical protein